MNYFLPFSSSEPPFKTKIYFAAITYWHKIGVLTFNNAMASTKIVGGLHVGINCGWTPRWNTFVVQSYRAPLYSQSLCDFYHV